jgi:hypothetical protein
MTISTVFDHFRAVQAWTTFHQAYASLDMNNLHLEVRCANRYFTFYPLFASTINGRLAHVSALSESVVAFGGWLPYRPYSIDLSINKLLFKQHLSKMGLRTPKAWQDTEIPTLPYITKRSQGSFGYGIAGPFAAHTAGPPAPQVPPTTASAQGVGTLFTEQFVVGKIVKVWLWGAKAMFADVQA